MGASNTRGVPRGRLPDVENGQARLLTSIQDRTCKGVNLGGWLLLEKWMNESIFQGTNAADEFTLCARLGESVSEKLFQHRESWITKEDFQAIKQAGLDSIRLPFGFWVLDFEALTDERRRPFSGESQERAWIREAQPYVGPCENYLWNALEWASELGLTVNLCLHGAPGGQSGHLATGFQDEHWRPTMWDRSLTVACLEHVAKKFGNHPALIAITVTNEPDRKISTTDLIGFYNDAYAAIRTHCAAKIVMPIYQRSWRFLHYYHCFPPADFVNVAFDVHLYFCFGAPWKCLSLRRLLAWSRSGCGHFPSLNAILRSGQAAMVSEWSLRLPEWENASWYIARDLEISSDRNQEYADFASNQMQFYRKTCAWYFWTWKVDARGDESHWDLRECLKRSWLSIGNP